VCLTGAAQAAIDLTEPQQLDLMHLRRIFYGRLGQLLRERKQLLSKLSGDTSDLYRTIEAVPESADIAPRLRENGLAEYRAYCQFASAFFRGVSLLYVPVLLFDSLVPCKLLESVATQSACFLLESLAGHTVLCWCFSQLRLQDTSTWMHLRFHCAHAQCPCQQMFEHASTKCNLLLQK
jgi:hypothetical protein